MSVPYISRTKESARLYRLEERATEAIIEAGKELDKFLLTNHYGSYVAHELATILDHFGPSIADEAIRILKS